MRYGSVCSGIEAATVAWHPLGFEPAWFSEIEPFPCAILKHHYPTVKNYGDITKFKQWPDSAIDILVGGTPCQSFSVAGLRAGLSDPRGNLALVFLGIVDRYRPRWVLWENVPGVTSSWSDEEVRAPTEKERDLLISKGLDPDQYEFAAQSSDLDCFVSGLEELGYGITFGILDAQYFGVAQRRERVFVVGCAGGQWQRAAAVLFDRSSLCGHPAPGRETGKTGAPTISSRAKGGGELGTDFECDGGVIPIQEIGKRQSGNPMNGVGYGEPGDPMFTIQSTAIHGIAHSLKAEGFDGSEDGTGRAVPLIPSTLPCVSSKWSKGSGGPSGGEVQNLVAFQPRVARNGHGADMGDKINALQAASTGSSDATPCVAFSMKGSGNDCQDDLAPTIRSGSHDKSHANGGVMPGIMNQMAVRRLTPKECERLQGFPDNYTLIPWKNKSADQCPDGPRYRALGNSMAVPVMRWLGERIKLVESCLS